MHIGRGHEVLYLSILPSQSKNHLEAAGRGKHAAGTPQGRRRDAAVGTIDYSKSHITWGLGTKQVGQGRTKAIPPPSGSGMKIVIYFLRTFCIFVFLDVYFILDT